MLSASTTTFFFFMTKELVKNYMLELVAALNKKTENQDPRIRREFSFTEGKKYFKIGTVYRGEIEKFKGKLGSIHALIDMNTGDVFKPAGSNHPAKGIRFNLLDQKSRELCLSRADQYGGYLYIRG